MLLLSIHIIQSLAESRMTTSKIPMINSSGNGYCKMGDGTLIQWGVTSIAVGSSSKTINFAVPFIDMNYGISLAGNFSTTPTVVITIGAKGTIACNCYLNSTVQGSVQPINWLAIGRWK